MNKETRNKSAPILNGSLDTLCEELLPHMVHHVFLPRHLETECSSALLERTETCLLATVCDIIEEFKLAHFPGSVKRLFTGMKQLYAAREFNPKTLSTQINALEASQMMGIYVRKANCAMFLMRSQSDDELIVATFQANLTNEAIYGDVEGGKINGDIQIDYPTRAIKVKMSDLIKSEVFAEQIAHFHQLKQNSNEDKSQTDAEASMQNFVSQWLIGAVSNRDSDVAIGFPIISKKMRDEPSHGFRRSGFWIAIKVFLQLGLTVELGDTIGKCVYKLIMLRLMAKMCRNLMDPKHNLTVNTAVEMLSKTARRMEKLHMFRIVDESICAEMAKVKEETAQHIENVQDYLEKHHAEHAIKNIRFSTQEKLNFAEHIVHTLPPELAAYLTQRKVPNYNVKVKTEKIEPDENMPEPEVYEPKAMPNLDQLNTLDNEIDKLRLFNHVENWVLKHLDDVGNVTPTYLRDLATEYFAKARDFFKSDPIGYSKMVLTMLKIIQFLDKRACDDLKIFSHHKSGVNPNIVENLTLTSRHHLEVLFGLHAYFMERNKVAKFPGPIEQNYVTNESFAARFAEQDAEMLDVKKRIQLEDEKKIAEKIDEVKRTRDKIYLDRLSVAEKKCNCVDYTNTNCEKCRIRKQINETRISRYRSVIMPEQHKMDALSQNGRIAMWPRKCVSWTEHPILHQFLKGCPTKYVFLGTDSSYMTKRSTRDDDFTEQIDAPDEDFIDRSSSNCLMCGEAQPKATKMPKSVKSQLIKKSVTFSVEPSSVYDPLQWTLESTNHSQNGVLASQSNCPANLSVAEYINFGSLRADGHRLQLRNLHRFLVVEGLSFETPSVLALVMQTLYEVGPSNTEWYRENNEDFVCLEFVHAMVNCLEKYIQRQQENWKNPLKLMVATLIVCRMIEINCDPVAANRLVAVLLQFRLTAINWMESIRATIENGNTNIGELYANLVDVAICGIHTFFVDCHHADFEKIFEPTGEYSAVNAWLRFVVIANHCYASCDQSQQRKSRELLMRMAQTIALNMECRLGALIANNPKQVQEFISFPYTGLEAIKSDYGVRHLLYKRHTIEVDAKIGDVMLCVQIDYVFGEFLVNGLPMGRLPKAITKHAIFKRMFGNTTFEVHSKDQVFTTVIAHHDKRYTFREDGSDEIAIIERHMDVSHCIDIDSMDVKELIPHTRLSKIVPRLLVENFSHWLNKERDVIEFRPKLFNDAHFASDIQYEFSFQTGLLQHMKTKCLLLDVCSESHENVAKLMQKLDHSKFVMVLMEDTYRARVELPRMKLSFTIDCLHCDTDYDIKSNEYIGMRVSSNQNVGTLYGLEFGLVLESVDTASSRLLIMPHSKFIVQPTYHHVEVKLASYDTKLRSPPFFVYSIDDQLCTLKATSSAAWFYLAHLHAVTSCPFPDPFTGMTGVERALQILQSGLAWSPSPYDRESMRTLQSLADLSPTRRFQSEHNKGKGHHQQSTDWPKHIRSHSAQDAFVLIVNKLVSDSVRLAHLFTPNQEKTSIKIDTMISLNARSYARYVQYAPNCGISESLLNFKHLDAVTHAIAVEDDRHLLNVRKLAVHFNEGGFCVPSEQPIDEMLFHLFSEKLLSGCPQNLNQDQTAISVQKFCSSSSFANLWIALYELIRRKQLSSKHLHLMLTLFAFKGIDVHHLFVLQAIAANLKAFEECEAPRFEFYEDVPCVDIDADAIKGAIDAAKTVNFVKGMQAEVKRFYEIQVESIKQKVIDTVNSQWPCDSIDMRSINFDTEVIYVNATVASDGVNCLLRKWYRNYELREFTRKIANIFAKISDSPPFTDLPEWPMCAADVQRFPKYVIDFDEKMCQGLGQHAEQVELARQIFVENGFSDSHQLDQMWKKFREISVSNAEKHLVLAQLYPRLMPTTVFPRLLRTKNTLQRNLIGALAVMTSRVQRSRRNAPEENEVATMHENWRPDQHPEWLLFEIEMNLSIRRVQVEIAKQMIHPDENKNSVMQLNMGEGKTSVIVPIVAAELANGQQLCTVNVLRQLFQTNLRSLRQCIGGLLGRRVYTLPCRRDLNIESDVDTVQQVLEECMENRGILMTIPEHRLSLQLKIYDAARKNRFANASKLLHVHNWLNKNSRHVLDESDAILQPNYQLVYSTGNQNSPEDGVLRWTCIQALLKRVPHHMKDLQDQNPTECQKVEYNADYVCDGVNLQNRPEIFTPCRLLDTTIYDSLKNSLANDIYAGKFSEFKFTAATQTQRTAILDLLEDSLTENQVKEVLDQFESINQTIQHTVLILCGLLKFDVLKLALSKRWRVNYGRNVNGTRKMAVPFKAKDVADEMTEFGHPDVAICLTQLSYYYSGLSDVELREVFLFLDRSDDAQGIYQEWIREVPFHLVPKSITTYNGVNLLDAKQRTEELFPIMRRNMYVIDYWLAHVVFPREAKLFDEKFMCTPWDLCSEQLNHPVTGFSGTNDMKELLPLPINQNDLPELLQTNEMVKAMLLREDNDNYHFLAANVSGMDILKKLVEDGIYVLLDAGALVLELNNEQVAREWLKMVPDDKYKAAVYFSDEDIIRTIDRNDLITEFENSAFGLDHCVVYLDDVHTRGTDLKFPVDTQACVTLSGGITHDKTVQACMRMRLLGRGHRISFWASQEAHIGILSGAAEADCITTADVIKYVETNSNNFKRDFVSHWFNASANYAQKVAAHKSLAASMQSIIETEGESSLIEGLLEKLRKRCSNSEKLSLKELYGAKSSSSLTKIVRHTYLQYVDEHETNEEIVEWIRKIELLVTKNLKCLAPDMKINTHNQYLDAECQKELEYELEENREVHRAKVQRKAIPPNFSKRLIQLFGASSLRWKMFERLKTEGTIQPLANALKNTKLYEDARIAQNLDGWSNNLWVTKDFLSVTTNHVDFLRPVWWVFRMHTDGKKRRDKDTFILISPFECNKLMPLFRQSGSHSTLHMFSAKLSATQPTLINDRALQLPLDPETQLIPLETVVQLAMFAGSMYFENAAEESEYCNFMGIIPSPSTPKQAQVLKSFAMKCGYIPVNDRKYFSNLKCGFIENPGKIAMGIIQMRYGYARKRSHAAQINIESKRFRWEE